MTPQLVGTNEVLQAIRVFDRATGRAEMATLCEAIAARVATDDEFADLVAVRIVVGTHDAVEYLARDRVGTENEVQRCGVTR